jgi:hypothetical protein
MESSMALLTPTAQTDCYLIREVQSDGPGIRRSAVAGGRNTYIDLKAD